MTENVPKSRFSSIDGERMEPKPARALSEWAKKDEITKRKNLRLQQVSRAFLTDFVEYIMVLSQFTNIFIGVE